MRKILKWGHEVSTRRHAPMYGHVESKAHGLPRLHINILFNKATKFNFLHFFSVFWCFLLDVQNHINYQLVPPTANKHFVNVKVTQCFLFSVFNTWSIVLSFSTYKNVKKKQPCKYLDGFGQMQTPQWIKKKQKQNE